MPKRSQVSFCMISFRHRLPTSSIVYTPQGEALIDCFAPLCSTAADAIKRIEVGLSVTTTSRLQKGRPRLITISATRVGRLTRLPVTFCPTANSIPRRSLVVRREAYRGFDVHLRQSLCCWLCDMHSSPVACRVATSSTRRISAEVIRRMEAHSKHHKRLIVQAWCCSNCIRVWVSPI